MSSHIVLFCPLWARSSLLKRALLNILGRAIVEMETRFSGSNPELMKAVNCLCLKSPSFVDVAVLSPLQKLDRHCM